MTRLWLVGWLVGGIAFVGWVGDVVSVGRQRRGADPLFQAA